MRNKEDTSEKGQAIGLLLRVAFSEDPSGLNNKLNLIQGERGWGEKPTPGRRTGMLTASGWVGLLHAPHYKNFSAKGTSTKRWTWRAKVQ